MGTEIDCQALLITAEKEIQSITRFEMDIKEKLTKSGGEIVFPIMYKKYTFDAETSGGNTK